MFDFVLTGTPIQVGGPVTVIPFVVTPDGTVLEGPPQSIFIALPGFDFVVVADPVFGSYTVGLQVNATPTSSWNIRSSVSVERIERWWDDPAG